MNTRTYQEINTFQSIIVVLILALLFYGACRIDPSIPDNVASIFEDTSISVQSGYGITVMHTGSDSQAWMITINGQYIQSCTGYPSTCKVHYWR